MSQRIRLFVGGAALAIGASIAVATPAFAETIGTFDSYDQCVRIGADTVNAPGGASRYECIGNGNPANDSTRWTLNVH
ncbi:hypothetical protein EV383_0472 [Pseudonocardia sediminis]|uniref:Ig-like domain-containing protein n=1 Tax=Pseudonocardia sediminis TaxID=1397368 RepID=A0A4V6ME90_PSEST|nr:hypothetical protein [Pseudonocardia sediminis]RZT83660.1 hypothetical protein EV383_0472 [Pseudonocardia sediminis]